MGAETLSSVKQGDRKVSGPTSVGLPEAMPVSPPPGYTALSLVPELLPKALKVSLLPAESPWPVHF